MRARNDDGGPAFPVLDLSKTQCFGMSMRDYFAAKAMVGITQALAQGIRPHDVPKLAEDAYFIADAMLAERSK